MPGRDVARFWVETLGCPKNAVDSDKIVASLAADGLERAADVADADLVVVNTCAFIEAARRESVDTILELADARRPGARLVVTGCLAERSGPELEAALPEVDAVVGFAGEGSLAALVEAGGSEAAPVSFLRRKPTGVRDLLELPRARPTAPWAYLKVAEGCDRACAFCAIPSFRGKQRSRTPDSIVAEARALVEGGVAELVLVAQDLAWYGRDAGEPGALSPLLRRLDGELAGAGLARLRLLYLYPSEVRDPLVATMLDTPSVVPYFDLSLQHADRALLARMKRWGSGERFAATIDAIRAAEPDAAFRSSFIVGFPGETEAAHEELLAFLDAAQLDWAGFFAFSEEDGTAAAELDGVVAPELVAERLRECEDVQVPITQAARDALVLAGAELDVLVDGADDETGDPVGRTHREAPEIDGVVRLAGAFAKPGVLVRARAVSALGPDVVATPVAVGVP
ncbi:MAG TPA: 30S ribosomal protein S12 methylthiotransferase RimO [Acidimicrobiia bacterium]|nr:30S ribosomal protein S12 methylthiotransferase RimO [Acidimicrobiia bacterium]